MGESAMSVSSSGALSGASSGSVRVVREVVLAGVGSAVVVDDALAVGVLGVLACPVRLAGVLGQVGRAGERVRVLSGAVTTVLVLALCLYCGVGYEVVIGRSWALMAVLNPRLWVCGTVSGAALSQTRARLPVAVLRRLFEVGADSAPARVRGLRAFGLVVTAVDGTVLDLAATHAISARYATPSGGRFPQARVVTLLECATRRVLGAVVDSSAVSEQHLWDRLVTRPRPGTLNLADRNFFSMDRWRIAAGTGAHLAWRVKNGAKSLPGTVIGTLPDGSHLIRLRESDAMRRTRRASTAQKKAPGSRRSPRAWSSSP